MGDLKDLILLGLGSALVSNVVLSQFLGLCPFLGVSKKNQDISGYGSCSYFRYYIGKFCNKYYL